MMIKDTLSGCQIPGVPSSCSINARKECNKTLSGDVTNGKETEPLFNKMFKPSTLFSNMKFGHSDYMCLFIYLYGNVRTAPTGSACL